MKKVIVLASAAVMMGSLVSCGGGSNIAVPAQPWEDITIQTQETPVTPADTVIPAYTILDKTQYDLAKFDLDKDGYYILFDGKTLNGWRGYGRDNAPKRWEVDLAEGAIKFVGSGAGEAQASDGGDLIFGHKFKNFELSIDWKCAKGSNSGIFYLAQEIKAQDPKSGEMRLEPIYISAPESQVLDNANHPDAKMGVDGNRMSSSLYDMIPAKPQNQKPFGEWNNTTITVFKGTVLHQQNGVNVVEYHLWTPQWQELLDKSKFSKDKWPLAYELLLNCGGANHEGYIGLQDHGDDVWFRNIKVKILD